jgi:hypothetical protein
MLASPYALACVLIIGVVAGFFVTPRTVGIACIALFVMDIVAMFVVGAVGVKTDVSWYLGIAGIALPIYSVIAFFGAQAGRAIRDKFGTKR